MDILKMLTREIRDFKREVGDRLDRLEAAANQTATAPAEAASADNADTTASSSKASSRGQDSGR